MGRLLKIAAVTLLTFGIFYTFNAGCVDFLKWYFTLQLLPQIVVGFAFGGVSWLMGKAVNLFILRWVNQQPSLTVYGLTLLSSLWLVHTIIIFSIFRFTFFELSWASVSAIILAAELSLFPLVAVFFQSRSIHRTTMGYNVSEELVIN